MDIENQTEEKPKQIPSEYFRRFDKTTQYQLKTIIECKPRIEFSSYFEKILSPVIITSGPKGTFSRIEILANYPTISGCGNLIMNAFYNETDKKSYSFGEKYTKVTALKRNFRILTEKIKKGYSKSCVCFGKIHSREIN